MPRDREAACSCNRNFMNKTIHPSGQHLDAGVLAFHSLTGAYLCRLAMFGDAIDTHLTSSDQGFAMSTAVRHASQFEQIAEFDELATKLEFSFGHSGFHTRLTAI